MLDIYVGLKCYNCGCTFHLIRQCVHNSDDEQNGTDAVVHVVTQQNVDGCDMPNTAVHYCDDGQNKVNGTVPDVAQQNMEVNALSLQLGTAFLFKQ